MATRDPLAGTPYFSFGRRPYREERLAAYIRREHRRGRHLGAILQDPYVRRNGGDSVVWSALRRNGMISSLERDIAEAIEASHPDERWSALQSTSMASPKE